MELTCLRLKNFDEMERVREDNILRETVEPVFVANKMYFKVKDLECFEVDPNYYNMQVIIIYSYTGRSLVVPYNESLITRLNFEINR